MQDFIEIDFASKSILTISGALPQDVRSVINSQRYETRQKIRLVWPLLKIIFDIYYVLIFLDGIVCDICKRQYEDLQELWLHQKYECIRSDYTKCIYCTNKYRDVRRHVQSKHPEKMDHYQQLLRSKSML